MRLLYSIRVVTASQFTRRAMFLFTSPTVQYLSSIELFLFTLVFLPSINEVRFYDVPLFDFLLTMIQFEIKERMFILVCWFSLYSYTRTTHTHTLRTDPKTITFMLPAAFQFPAPLIMNPQSNMHYYIGMFLLFQAEITNTSVRDTHKQLDMITLLTFNVELTSKIVNCGE